MSLNQYLYLSLQDSLKEGLVESRESVEVQDFDEDESSYSSDDGGRK